MIKHFGMVTGGFLLLCGLNHVTLALDLGDVIQDEGVTIIRDVIPTPNAPAVEATPILSSDKNLSTITNDILTVAIDGSIDSSFAGQVIADISNTVQRIYDPLLAGKLPGIVGDRINEIIESDAQSDLLGDLDEVLEKPRLSSGCQVMTPPAISLNFDDQSSSVIKRSFNISVLCPEGDKYGVKSISRGQEKSRFVMMMKSDERRIPAVMDVRHSNGQTLDGLTFQGNGEVQTISMQAILLASNGNMLSGDIVPIDPIAIRVERK